MNHEAARRFLGEHVWAQYVDGLIHIYEVKPGLPMRYMNIGELVFRRGVMNELQYFLHHLYILNTTEAVGKC